MKISKAPLLYLRSFVETPKRIKGYASRYPFESVAYGTILLAVSLISTELITVVSAIAIVQGIYYTFNPLPRK